MLNYSSFLTNRKIKVN